MTRLRSVSAWACHGSGFDRASHAAIAQRCGAWSWRSESAHFQVLSLVAGGLRSGELAPAVGAVRRYCSAPPDLTSV